MTKTAGLYGGSLYDLAQEMDCVQEMQEQLEQIRSLFRETPEYVHLLSEPSLAVKERCGLLDEAFPEANKYLLNFLKLLCERGLLWEFGGCCEEFTRRFRQDQGIASAVVTTAVALSADQLDALKEKLEAISGRKVQISTCVDEKIIGGIKVELEGREMDGTIKGRLNGISRMISEAGI